MNNFGVIELASARRTNAPGWAYVPDRQQQQHLIPASTSTSNRKRARAAASGGAQLSLADANARQEAKARREIEILDRDNAREVQIAIPAKPGVRAAGAGGGGGKKYTPNVRKILQSQKTFANHLDDYIALLSQQESNPTPTPAPSSNTNANPNNGGANANTRAGQRQGPSSSKRPNTKHEPEDVEMLDISQPPHEPQSTILTPYAPPPPHQEDTNPLLASRLPPLPSDDELRALLAAPPLSYLEARGTWPPRTGGNGRPYPTRVFCVVCGYWGRVRCMKCGTRVCALECLETHQEECITRYGM
ncbi:hypothetical protein E0Z10_g984 [Xylaria hypoxylon]|uniref:HIT-type domain-containing protein n=1 Tax=Xylaria hypoxylon TaxID=37992 RepID=A0A4Z0Z9Y5_9PEZI|nr:hypothetical protein E0Z10_g984 [Xylaria hypoxylon]